MPRLLMVTVPGLEVKSAWRPVHDRLLDEFPAITDVLATTIPETVLIAYQDHADADAWLEAVNQALTLRRLEPHARAFSARASATRSRRPQPTFQLAPQPNTERNPI